MSIGEISNSLKVLLFLKWPTFLVGDKNTMASIYIISIVKKKKLKQ